MAEKNAIKEGAKRAQTFSAMHKGSGLQYFCTTVDIADGNVSLIKKVMDGANNDKKAKQWGKYFLSSNDTTLVGWGYVPEELAKNEQKQEDQPSKPSITINEWTEALLSYHMVHDMKKEYLVDENNAFYKGFVLTMDPDREQFAFKVGDELVQRSIDFLRQKGLLKKSQENESDDEDYAASVGIEW